MNARAIAAIAAVIAWLAHCHVTLWLAGHPVATIPALGLAVILAAAVAVAGVFAIRRLAAFSVPGTAYAT